MWIGRRAFLQGIGGAVAAGATVGHGHLVAHASESSSAQPLARRIRSSGEKMPIVGLGSWITFNVGRDQALLDESADVIKAFLAGGGRMIDSSPMYGSSQATIGYALKKLGMPDGTFAADKIWTSSQSEGPAQFSRTQGLWGLQQMDLMQIHNLVAWRSHLSMLQELKASGKIRYIGITTSHGRRHRELEDIMSKHDLDFVQLTYNIRDREPEARLLPLARERGIAVIVNRPYQRGALLRRFSGKPLPPLAQEIGAQNWAQFLLKFVLSHPDVTCAIPATTKVAHVKENLAAAAGPLPELSMRKEMFAAVERL